MKSRSSIVSLVLSLLLALSGFAAELNFPGTKAIDPVKLLPAPPSPDSAESRAELALMVGIQRYRTPAEVDCCRAEVNLTAAAYASVLGPWLKAENLPALEALFRKLDSDSKFLSGTAKAHFGRKRPAVVDQRIQTAIENETSLAYPSGHATRGMMYALVLAQLAPEKRDALLERGREIGWNRVIAGLHRPSDIVAGRVLGQALVRQLLEDPKFQEELAKAKAEFDEVKQKNAPPPSNQ
jgi:acid phosphatase (class A)